MKRLEDVISLFGTNIADRAILEDFIARGWIQPRRDETDFLFEDIDIARIRLVCELYHNFELDTESMDLVLTLIDRLHIQRTAVSALLAAIEDQPEEVRSTLVQSLRYHIAGHNSG